MSQENVEVVRRDVAARAARDWSTLHEIWDPEIQLVLVGGSGTIQGIDEITRFFDSLSDSYDEYRVEAAGLREYRPHRLDPPTLR